MIKRTHFPRKTIEKPRKAILPLSIISAFFLAYLTCCGVIYHLGYWSTFGFNYLEYADLSNLFKSIVYPFFSKLWIYIIIIFFVLGMMFLEAPSRRLKRKRLNLPPYEPMKMDFENYSDKVFLFDFLISILALVGAGLMMFLGDRWSHISVPMIGIASGLMLVRFGFLKQYIEDDFIRTGFIVLLIFFATYQFTLARKIALKVKSRIEYKKIHSIKTDDRIIDSLLIGNPFLGSSGNFTFILTQDNKVLLINNSQIKYMSVDNWGK